MEIGAQVSVQSTSSSTASASSAKVKAGQGDGFSTALKEVVGNETAAATEEGAAGGGTAGLQKLAAGASAVTGTAAEGTAAAAEQVEALIALLEQQDAAGMDELLNNPELQALLAQLQSSSPQLFVPLEAAGADGAEGPAAAGGLASAGIGLAEATALLQQLKSGLQGGKLDQQLQQAVKELPAMLLGTAGGDLSKLQGSTQTPAAQQSQAAPAAGEAAPAGAPAGTSPTQQLEVLAAKHGPVLLKVEGDTQQLADDPLFVPLNAEGEGAQVTAGEAPPVLTVQDLAKNPALLATPGKMPTLMMQSSSFSEEMTQLAVQSFLLTSKGEGLTEAKISLYPQHLGHVEVKLTMQNGQLIAQLTADNPAGKEMLESQLSQLRSTLQSQGIQVQKLEVTQGQAFQSGMFQENRQQGQQQSQQSSKGQKAASARIAGLDGDDGVEGISTRPERDRAVRIGTGAIDVIA